MYGSRAEQTTLETLLEQFDVRNEDKVHQYLRQYPFLLSLIHEAQAQIARLFDPERKAALEVSTDPSDGSSQLYLVIPTRLKAEEAYARLERLDEEWWLEASERAQFHLNVIPEFI